MPYNSMLGSREILRQMTRHKAAQAACNGWQKQIADSYGHLIIKIFGYPLDIHGRLLIRDTLDYFKDKPRSKILDVGCSHGAYVFELAKQGHEIVGVDINNESISLANTIRKTLKMKNIKFHCTSVEDYQTTEKFDYIMMYETLEHIKDDGLLIRKLWSLLNDDGVLLVSVPYANAIVEYDQPVGACRGSDGKFVYIADGGGHYRNGYNLETLGNLLMNNGYAITDKKVQKAPKFLPENMALFPLTYPLLLLFHNRGSNPIKSRVIAKKIPSTSAGSG